MNDLSFLTRNDPETGRPMSPEGKRKVFLSYKHTDEAKLPLCKSLASYILDAHDVAVWYDSQLTAGQRYDDEIRSAIRQSDAFILILTPSILTSDYVWLQEVPFAKKQQVAVIPVVAGLSEAELPKVEEHLGRIHMPVWFFGKQEAAPAFHPDALKQLTNSLAISIANKDLLSQVTRFYEKGTQNVSLRHLTPEQIFMKAYGCLFGVDAYQDKGLGIKLFESILSLYGNDAEFIQLQQQVSLELLNHFYRSDQPELFLTYIKAAIERGYQVAPLLSDVYRNQWHPELLAEEPGIAQYLFEQLYKKTGEVYDGAAIRKALEGAGEQPFGDAATPSQKRTIGALHFGEHITYLRKAPSESGTAELVVDGRHICFYEVCAGTDPAFLFLAYDSEHDLLNVLHSDFDHYGPETIFCLDTYLLGSGTYRKYSAYSEWIRGLCALPYYPYLFDVHYDQG